MTRSATREDLEEIRDNAEAYRQVLLERRERTERMAAAVAGAVLDRREAIEADPTISTITLVVRLDRGPDPQVLYRTESAPRR